MPLPPVEREGSEASQPNEQLATARRLYAAREWAELVRWAAALPPATVLAEPELAFRYADALNRTGSAAQALTLAEEIESDVRLSADRRLILEYVNLRGIILFGLGRWADAEGWFGELLDRAAEWHDDEFAARASNNLGVVANIRGRRDLALTAYQRARASYYRLGYLRGLAQTHHNLALSYRDLGFDGEADAHCRRAADYAERSDSQDVRALAETERAMLRARAGDHRLAEKLGRSALRRFDAIGDPLGRAEALRVLATAARTAGRDQLALRRLAQALSLARTHDDPWLLAEVQRDRGLLLRDRHRMKNAREALTEAATRFEEMGATAEALAVRAIVEAL